MTNDVKLISQRKYFIASLVFKKHFLIICTSIPAGFDHLLGHGDDYDGHRGRGGRADGLLG